MRNEPGDLLTAIVVAGGTPPDAALGRLLPDHDLVVAADSGLHGARALGLEPHVVIGDMDSVDPAALEAAERGGAVVQRVPHDKDAVDTELALHAAVAHGARRIILVTGGGGRLDHAVGVLNCLLHPLLAGREVHALWGDARMRVLHGPERAEICGPVGSTIGLLAAGGDAHGIVTEGLRWSLDDEDLPAHSTRGVSNELASEVATVSLRAGRLLVIQPAATEH
jgi:thiamine pyrophosphokinase